MKKERNFTNFENRMPLFGSRNAGGAGLGLNLDAHQAKDRKVPATAEAPTSARAADCIGCEVLAENLPLGGS